MTSKQLKDIYIKSDENDRSSSGFRGLERGYSNHLTGKNPCKTAKGALFRPRLSGRSLANVNSLGCAVLSQPHPWPKYLQRKVKAADRKSVV